jgi:hypothetical protein
MEKILMGGVVAFAAFTLLSYILIIFNIPLLIIPIIILAVAVGFRPTLKIIKSIKIAFSVKTILVVAVFTIGVAGQLAVIAPSGILKNNDLLFWSAHGHDGPWHIALMEEIKKGYPFQNPSFAGEKLVNYHFFSDIAPAIVSKYLPISNLDLYFRIFPFIYSLFLGASAFYLTKKITNSFSASIWAVVFTYFSGSFGYIIGKGESVFWATQPQSSSGNPPQIISNFLVLSSLYFLMSYLKSKNDKRLFAVCVLLLGTLVGFKVYAAVALLGAIGIAGLWQLIKDRKPHLILLSIVSGALAAIIYFPNTSGSTSFLIFEPWWYIRTMIVEPSRLNLLDWELRRQTYIFESNWKRVIYLEGVGFLIFFFGNLGMRFLGIWEFIKSHIIFKTTIVISLILPLLFLQKGVASNTSQFLQYFVLLFGILSGIAASKLTAKLKFLIPVIIILMIPTQLKLLTDFYGTPEDPRPALAKVSSQELEALNYIKDVSEKDSVIVTPPYNQYLDLKKEIPDIWDWFDTSYISAFSQRRTYFDDYEQADIMGYDINERTETKKKIFENEKVEEVKASFSQTNGNLLYYPKVLRPKVNPELLGLSKFFENEEIEVWKSN